MEPTVVFLFDLKQWGQTISPISKIDLVDIAPIVSAQFFFDVNVQSYAMIITKEKWSSLSTDLKKKFMIVSRRLKEEMEGPMTSIKREQYENSDLFDFYMNRQKTIIETETSNEETNSGSETTDSEKTTDSEEAEPEVQVVVQGQEELETEETEEETEEEAANDSDIGSETDVDIESDEEEEHDSDSDISDSDSYY